MAIIMSHPLGHNPLRLTSQHYFVGIKLLDVFRHNTKVICSGPCCVMDGVHNICTLLLPKPCHKLPGEVGTEQLTFANAFQSQMKEAQSGSPVMRECGKDHDRATPRTLLNSKPRPRPPQKFGDRGVLRALLQLFGGDLCLSTFS